MRGRRERERVESFEEMYGERERVRERERGRGREREKVRESER